jgi:type I restriction enzyme, S subunit
VSELPKGWALVPLSEVTRHKSGNSKLIKGKLVSEPGAGLFPAFSATGQDVWRNDFEYSGEAIIVSAVGARCGKCFLADGVWSAVANTHIVWPDEEALHRRFLWYLINDEGFWVKGGSAQPFVKVTATFSGGLSLPPIEEQRRIVTKLDSLFARTHSAREELARIPRLIEHYKQAILAAAFRGELTDMRPFSEWHVQRIGELSEVGTGATPKRGRDDYYAGGTIPWITSGAVNSGRIQAAEQYITEKALAETNCKVFSAGALVVAMYGEGMTRGKVAWLEIDAATNQAVAVLHEFSEAILPEYLSWFLHWNYLAIRKLAAGGVQPNLNLGIIRNIEVRFPEQAAEQRRIVETIRDSLSWLDSVASEHTAAWKLLDHLDQATLAKAFRGELVPQNPNDEPAAVLLERIRAARAAQPKPKRRGRTAAAD